MPVPTASPTEAAILDALRAVQDPDLHQDIVTLGFVKDLRVCGDQVAFQIELTTPACPVKDLMKAQAEQAVRRLPGVGDVTVQMTARVTASRPLMGDKGMIPGVKNVIAVSSGKGGVGKSTVAVNLALAWAAQGARVGLLDADVYGPSQPIMLGLQGERPTSVDGKRIKPLRAHGVAAMSIGFLVDVEQPMAWRGPMVTSALNQLLADTEWGELDYLVVDMPPGTGDIQLTLAQRVPVAGAVIVTTPQDIALADARKGLRMFEKVHVPVLGIVENMATHVCSRCGHAEHIFGEGGGARMAADYGVQLLGSLPLDARIRAEADGGKPSVVADPASPRAAAYHSLARRAAGELARRGRDRSALFPKIVVEDT